MHGGCIIVGFACAENCVTTSRIKSAFTEFTHYPNSRWPPGSPYVPLPAEPFRLPSRIQPGWSGLVMKTATPTLGRFAAMFCFYARKFRWRKPGNDLAGEVWDLLGNSACRSSFVWRLWGTEFVFLGIYGGFGGFRMHIACITALTPLSPTVLSFCEL